MTDAQTQPRTGFAAFAHALGTHLDMDSSGWSESDLLVDQLGWDSLVAVEVVSWLEERGIRLPDDLLAEIRTLGDIYHYTGTLAPSPGEPRRIGSRLPLQGRRVRLIPLTAAHHGEALDMFTRGNNLIQFRFRGTTPSPETFGRVLWDRVLCQFAVVDRQRLVAIVTAFEPDMRNRHCHVAVVSHADAPKGAGMEGLVLLIDHLFAEFDLRKVYAEALEPNAATFSSGLGRVAKVEGRLTEHEFMGGRYHDMLVIAITRERWEAHATRLLGPPS